MRPTERQILSAMEYQANRMADDIEDARRVLAAMEARLLQLDAAVDAFDALTEETR